MLVRRVSFVSFLAVSVLCAADPPSGASLMDRFIERSGGADAYARAKNVSMNGTVELAGRNLNGSVTVVQEGLKSYTVIDLPGLGPVEEGFDGETAWSASSLQGPRILDGDEKIAVKRASSLASMSAWRDIYKEARTTGSEDVGGKPAWKVEMTPSEGKPETFYFDKASGLLVRITTILGTPVGDIPSETTLSDYRMVDGIQTSFTMTQKAMNQDIVMHFDKIAYNAPIPKGRFDLPAGVKTLLDKKKK
jgi:hypothetical protein